MNISHKDSMHEQAKLVLDHLESTEEPDYRFVAVHAEALVQQAWAAIAESESDSSQEL